MSTDDVDYATFSGWVDPPADILPALTGDLTCDVAVVGDAGSLIADPVIDGERPEDLEVSWMKEARFPKARRVGSSSA